MGSAQAGLFGTPSDSPSTYAMSRSAPTVQRSRNASSCSPSVMRTKASASITAASVPGTTGCQVARTSGGRSLRQRAEQLEGQPSPARLGQGRREGVAGDAARAHPGVLRVHAAEGDDELRVLEDGLPRRRPAQHLGRAAHHVREDDVRGAERVRVDRRRVAAEAVQEPVQLALRVVEAAGAGPPVGPAEDRLVAVLLPHPTQLGGDPFDRLAPLDLDEVVGAAGRVGPRPPLEPAPADRRPLHPRLVAHAVEEVGQQRRRRRVIGMALDADDAVVLDRDAERAPVGQVRQRARHGPHHSRRRANVCSRPARGVGWHHEVRRLTGVAQPIGPAGDRGRARLPPERR